MEKEIRFAQVWSKEMPDDAGVKEKKPKSMSIRIEDVVARTVSSTSLLY